MTLLNKIIDLLNTSPDDDKLYLIEKCSDVAGFFVYNKQLVYMAKNNDLTGSISLKTEYLQLQSNVNIISVENSQNFESGCYNIIEYKVPLNENFPAFESFVKLCLAHVKIQDSKNFVDFFNSLIELFKNEKLEKKQNVFGLFGELSLIYYFLKEYNLNLASYWHISGTYSKYDFSANKMNIEVKTSSSEKDVLIKHSQVFNDDENYLAVSIVENNNSGMTLMELEERLKEFDSIAKDFNFLLNLETEKVKLVTSDYINKKLKLLDINLYDCKNINPFNKIPDNISNLEYRINLSNSQKTRLEDFVRNVRLKIEDII